MSIDLDIRDLTLSYGPVRALYGVSLKVSAGEIAALVGSNGAGKSSVLRSISNLVTPDGGKILLDGQEMPFRPGAALRQGVALSPEGRRLFVRLTVEENLLMGAYTARNRAATRQMLERVYDYFPRVRERRRQVAGSLSGGEQQMVAIGRALMAQPKLLLLDEPSLGIAPIIVAELGRIITEINRELGITVLLVEQNANMALALSSKGFVMETGKVMLSGTGEELLRSDEIRKAYLGS
jgi:branched-chain amino acid transport system ATP-binding protein